MACGRSAIHEVDFCTLIASEVNIFVSQNPGTFPFREARVEGYGTGASRRKRKDLRFFDTQGKLALCGEVKLPGTPEGRSPYHKTRDAARFCRQPFGIVPSAKRKTGQRPWF